MTCRIDLVLLFASAAAFGQATTAPHAPAVSPPAPPVITPASTSQPAATPAPATSVPTSSGDPAVDALLDRLEARGAAIRGLSTTVEYNDIRFNPVEDKITKRGELFFLRGEPNSKFLILFHETVAGGVTIKGDEYYLFDGAWFIERKDKGNSIVRRQIVRPNQRIDPFKVGQGPFPLPFGQRRGDMIANFTITKLPPRRDDPANTDCLHCVPRANTELARRYLRVDMWIDRSLELPVRIEVERSSDENIIDTRFTRLNPADAPAASRFQIDQGLGKEWSITDEPLDDVAEPPAPPAPRR